MVETWPTSAVTIALFGGVRQQQVNLPKHLVGAIPTFSYAGPIFQEPELEEEKAAKCRGELN
jgi:hypothetical protein